jgi:hypothetical protein
MHNPDPPKELVALQEWFSQAVTCSSNELKSEHMKIAQNFIESSQSLNSTERLEVYMNDYWPRCFNALEEDFPLLVSYFGEEKFRALMQDYLTKFPSTSFTLYFIGKRLPQFFETHYHDTDKEFLCELSQYEWNYCSVAVAKEEPAFNPALLSDNQKQQLLTLPISLQASVCIMPRHYQRSYTHKESNEKISTSVVIYRKNNKVVEEPIPVQLGNILTRIQQGDCIQAAVESVVQNASSNDIIYIEQHIEQWLAHCVENQFFVQPKKGD